MLGSFAGGELFGRRFGDGVPRVLALHGWGRSHRDFEAVLGTPPPFDAVAVDLPGFGVAPPPAAVWGSAEYAAAVAPLLDEMQPPVVVLGHSFGGRIALHLATAHPDVVGGLVLTGVPLLRPPGGRRPAPMFRLGRVLHRRGLLSEDRMERLRQRYGSADYRAAAGVMRQVLVRVVNERYEDAMAAVGCPVALVWGSDDHVAPLSVARSARSLFAAADLVEVPGAGHLTPLTASEELREALRRSLAGVSGGRAAS